MGDPKNGGKASRKNLQQIPPLRLAGDQQSLASSEFPNSSVAHSLGAVASSAPQQNLPHEHEIADLRKRYASLRTPEGIRLFLLSLTPEQRRALVGGQVSPSVSATFDKIEKEHQPNWWLMEDLASSTVISAPLMTGGLAGGLIAAVTDLASKVAIPLGIYGTAQEMLAAITGKSTDGKPLPAKERARAIFHAASALFGLATGALMAFGGRAPRVKSSTIPSSHEERLPQTVPGGRALGPGSASGDTKSPSQFKILVVGAETDAEFAYAAEVTRSGQDVLVVNPKVTPAAESYSSTGGNFVRGKVEDLPAEPAFNLIREDFPYPLDKAYAPTLKLVHDRLIRLKPGGKWVVVTEKEEFASTLELAAEVSGAKISSRPIPAHHEAAPQSSHPRDVSRYVLIIEKQGQGRGGPATTSSKSAAPAPSPVRPPAPGATPKASTPSGTGGKTLPRRAPPPSPELRRRAQQLVEQCRAESGEVVVNLGGTGEEKGAINVNALVSEVPEENASIPNLLHADTRDVGSLFPAGSVDRFVSYDVEHGWIDWGPTAKGAFAALRSGGEVLIAPYVGNMVHIKEIIRALQAARFTKIQMPNGGSITARKP